MKSGICDLEGGQNRQEIARGASSASQNATVRITVVDAATWVWWRSCVIQSDNTVLDVPAAANAGSCARACAQKSRSESSGRGASWNGVRGAPAASYAGYSVLKILERTQ